MRRRSNPWPALVDLFGALLIATFAGLMLMYKHEATGVEKQAAMAGRAKKVFSTISTNLKTTPMIVSQPPTQNDLDRTLNIDMNVAFARSDFDVPVSALPDIDRVASEIKEVIGRLKEPRFIQIVVEGHTDSVDVRGNGQRYRDNWELSSRRAASVLAELTRQGIEPKTYSIVSVGYSDTKPKCQPKGEACDAQNRRTTVRLQVDPRFAEELVPASQTSQPGITGSTTAVSVGSGHDG